VIYISSIKQKSKNTLTFLIAGERGNGKTLFMCIMALLFEASHKQYFTNFSLNGNFIKHRLPFSITNFYNYPDVKAIFLDEMHNISDQYSNQASATKLLVALFSQSRKRGQLIMLSTQFVDKIAKDLRNLIDIIVYPRFLEREDRLYLFLWDLKRHGKIALKVINNVSRFFKYYDTDEIIYSDEIIESLTNYMLQKKKVVTKATKHLTEDELDILKNLKE